MLALVAIASCVWIIWAAAAFGYSRLLSKYSIFFGSLPAADEAVRRTPSDAEARLARGEILAWTNARRESVAELERAVALRPADYYLWLELGISRDQAGDQKAALPALNEAVRLAPFYALPRWQRGNLLLRSGRFEEAFADLSQAAQSNPELAPTLIDLAWGLSKGNTKLTEQLAQITTDRTRIMFVRFLARQGKTTEALAQARNIRLLPDDVRHELLQRFITAGAVHEAFEIWRLPAGESDANRLPQSIYDGGYEGSLNLNEAGFGWRVANASQAVKMSLDSDQPHTGSRSLRIDFAGDSNPDSPLVSQLVLVHPSIHYRINFASRSHEIVTGGLPVLIVHDGSGEQKLLGQSSPIVKGTSAWRILSVEFTTGPATKGIFIGVQRERCTTSPCPIFGTLWLDSFSLERLN